MLAWCDGFSPAVNIWSTCENGSNNLTLCQGCSVYRWWLVTHRKFFSRPFKLVVRMSKNTICASRSRIGILRVWCSKSGIESTYMKGKSQGGIWDDRPQEAILLWMPSIHFPAGVRSCLFFSRQSWAMNMRKKKILHFSAYDALDIYKLFIYNFKSSFPYSNHQVFPSLNTYIIRSITSSDTFLFLLGGSHAFESERQVLWWNIESVKFWDVKIGYFIIVVVSWRLGSVGRSVMGV